jgi:hypothetical protein
LCTCLLMYPFVVIYIVKSNNWGYSWAVDFIFTLAINDLVTREVFFEYCVYIYQVLKFFAIWDVTYTLIGKSYFIFAGCSGSYSCSFWLALFQFCQLIPESTSSSYFILVPFPIFRENFIKNIKNPLTSDVLYLDEGLRMNSNYLYIHVYYSFPMYYFNIKYI